MKKWMRKGLRLVLAVTLLVAGGLMLRQLLSYEQAEETADRAREMIVTRQTETHPTTRASTEPIQTQPPETSLQAAPRIPLEENAAFLLEMDYSPLREENPDVLGWIHIPDTIISYPLLRSHDNEEYLHLAWDGTASISGSIFLEMKNDPAFLDFNTIIYGHHMANGSFFAPLLQYREKVFRDEHPFIYILSDSGLRRYEVFAAYEADITGLTYYLNFRDQADRLAALEGYAAQSVWETDYEPLAQDQILTLSTCTGTGIYTTRWVVQARLAGLWIP